MKQLQNGASASWIEESAHIPCIFISSAVSQLDRRRADRRKTTTVQPTQWCQGINADGFLMDGEGQSGGKGVSTGRLALRLNRSDK